MKGRGKREKGKEKKSGKRSGSPDNKWYKEIKKGESAEYLKKG